MPGSLQRTFLALLLACTPILPLFADDNPPCYDIAQNRGADLYQSIRYLAEPEGDRPLQPADLDPARMLALEYESVSLGFARTPHWFVMCVQNSAAQPGEAVDLVLGMHNTFIELVQFYEGRLGTAAEPGPLLGLQSDSRQTWPVYRFTLNGNETRQVYWRINTRSPLRYSAELATEEEFYRSQSLMNAIIGGLICAVLALACYNLILYFQLGDSNYLRYFGFLFFLCAYRIFFHGLLVPYLPEIARTHYLMLTIIFAELTAYFLIRWMLVFLNVAAYSRRAYWLGNALALSCVLTIAWAFFDPFTSNRVIAIKALATILLSIPVPVLVWRQGYRPALWFIVAFAMAPINVSALVLASFGLLPFDLFIRLSIDITSLGQAILLSFALADRISIRERGHREGLAARVAERTRELRQEVELRREAQEKAENATRAREDFLANMSHEIRTPMNAILGMADLLAETRLNASQSEYIQTFQRAGRNLQRLLNDVLDISRIDSGALPVVEQPFDLHALLDDLERIHATLPASDAVALRFERAPDVPQWILGDAGRLSQVLMNLLSNALKFTERGSVQLSATRTHDRLELRVRDTGTGMAPEELERIFERFFQIDMSYARRTGGSGLGLAISHRLAELMGGRLSAESAIGAGSEFCLELPCRTVSPPEVASPSAGAAAVEPATRTKNDSPSPEGAGVRILGVDDSEDNRELLRHYFKRSPHSIDLAESGEAALRMFRAADPPYALVFMDIQMPGMDGFETTHALREWLAEQSETHPAQTPIVALTAYATEREVAAIRNFNAGPGNRRGFDGYLQKPIAREILMTAVDELLSSGELSIRV